MWKLIDKTAGWFVPPELRNDPETRRLAMRYLASARMLMVVVVVINLTVLFVFPLTYPDYTTELILVLCAMAGNFSAAILMRAFRAFLWPLLFANFSGFFFFACAVFISGGISSPAIFILITPPALTINFGDRRLFLFSCAAVLFVFASLFLFDSLGWMPEYAPRPSEDIFRFVVLVGSFLLLVMGGVSAQVSIGRMRLAVKETSQTVLDKNEMLEALSGKLSKYLSPQVYSSIFEGKQDVKLGASRKELTVFFVDIVKFTETSEHMDVDDISYLINEYFENIAEIILHHGGTIDKYMGDAIMVFFGDPDTKGTRQDAIACVRMALAMEVRLQELQKLWQARGIERPFVTRAGINSGVCTVGNFGSENRLDYTIIGTEVNIAARLETAADPGVILISAQTHGLVSDTFDCTEVGALKLRGIRNPVTAFQVNSQL